MAKTTCRGADKVAGKRRTGYEVEVIIMGWFNGVRNQQRTCQKSGMRDTWGIGYANCLELFEVHA